MLDKKHVMIDLETMGLSSDSLVIGFAIVEFQFVSGSLIISKHTTKRLKPEQDGRSVDVYTVAFHRSNQYGKEFVKDVISLTTTNGNFLGTKEFLHAVYTATIDADYVWCKSVDFDIAIINDMFSKDDIFRFYTIPYNMRMDVRPFSKMISKEETKDVRSKAMLQGDFMGYNFSDKSAHDPLYDCLVQIYTLQNVFGKYYGK